MQFKSNQINNNLLINFRRQKEKRVTPETQISLPLYSQPQTRPNQSYGSHPINYNYPYDQISKVKTESD